MHQIAYLLRKAVPGPAGGPLMCSCVSVTVPASSMSSWCRITVLAAICLTQAFMMWKFINFQLRRWREHAQLQAQKRKPAAAKGKAKKDRGGVGSTCRAPANRLSCWAGLKRPACHFLFSSSIS